jgi:hypothetical protein
VEEAKRLWESEKAELVKARDEAVSQYKVNPSLIAKVAFPSFVNQAAIEQARNASEEAKNIRLSNVRCRLQAT